MATEISNKVVCIQDQVFKQNYYMNQWVQALRQHNMSTASIDQHEHSDSQLVSLCNTFWILLPDSPELRFGPFFLLCSVAEHAFD